MSELLTNYVGTTPPPAKWEGAAYMISLYNSSLEKTLRPSPWNDEKQNGTNIIIYETVGTTLA